MTRALGTASIGPVAAAICARAGACEVITVFERSFYLSAPAGIVCIAASAIGDGPINLLLAPAEDFERLRGRLRSGAKGTVGRRRITFDAGIEIDLTGTRSWAAPPWPTLDRTVLERNLAAVRTMAADICPPEGMSRIVLAPEIFEPGAFGAGAALAVDAFLRAIAPAVGSGVMTAPLADAAVLLLGLGPGLTPSGDDLLGGALLALDAAGQTSLRNALWDTLAPEIDMLTVEISAAHLAAAADGLASAAAHRALAALLAGPEAEIANVARDLARIGHSSGADTLAGMVAVLSAVSSRPPTP